MKKTKGPDRRHMTPVFLLVDAQREAVYRIQQTLHSEWLYVSLTEPRLVVPYARRLMPTAIFLAEPPGHSTGEIETLLRDLLTQVHKPVVILVELWTPHIAEAWKKRGADDCLPHPTRTLKRLNHLGSKMREFALAEFQRQIPPSEWPPWPPRSR